MGRRHAEAAGHVEFLGAARALRRDRVDDAGSVFGYTDFAAIAKGSGLRGTNVTELGQLQPLFEAYAAQDKAEVWNIHISDKVVAPQTRRTVSRGHGGM